MRVPPQDLAIVKNVVGMLHTASLLMDDVEDDSHLRRGLPGALLVSRNEIRENKGKSTRADSQSIVAHKIYGVPQTINSANYVYFLAYQELSRINPNQSGIKIEESVTRRSDRSTSSTVH